MYLSPYFLLTVAAITWSSNFIIGKILVGVVPPATLNFLRWIMPLVFCMPFSIRELQRNKKLYLKHFPLLVILAVTGYCLNGIPVYHAVHHTSAINASFIASFNPIVFAILGYTLFRERLSFLQGFGIFMSLLGVSLIVFRGNLLHVLSFKVNLGDILMFISVLSWGFYSVLYKNKGRIFPDRTFFIAIIPIAILVNLPFTLVENLQTGIGWISQLEAKHYLAIIALNIFPSLLPTLLWNNALLYVSSNQAAIFLNLIPVFTTIFSILLLREQFFIYHLLGGLLIFSGVMMVNNTQILKEGFIPSLKRLQKKPEEKTS